MTINNEILIHFKKFIDKYLCVECNNVNDVDNDWEVLNNDYKSDPALPDLLFKIIQDNYNPIYVGLEKYKEFLNTKYWKIISAYLRQKINKCEFKYSHNNKYLEIHHKTYDILGKELQNLSDLVCLCSKCHKIFHENEVKEFMYQDSNYNSQLRLDNLNKLINNIQSTNHITELINNVNDNTKVNNYINLVPSNAILDLKIELLKLEHVFDSYI